MITQTTPKNRHTPPQHTPENRPQLDSSTDGNSIAFLYSQGGYIPIPKATNSISLIPELGAFFHTRQQKEGRGITQTDRAGLENLIGTSNNVMADLLCGARVISRVLMYHLDDLDDGEKLELVSLIAGLTVLSENIEFHRLELQYELERDFTGQ